jgi:hypothetical protein
MMSIRSGLGLLAMSPEGVAKEDTRVLCVQRSSDQIPGEEFLELERGSDGLARRKEGDFDEKGWEA